MSKVEKNINNIEKCICGNCPSYNKCAEEKKEKLYCAKDVGKSSCEFKMNGCICGNCPIHKENELLSWYYCMNGSVDEIDVKK